MHKGSAYGACAASALSNGALDVFDGGAGVGNLDDESLIGVVVLFDDNRLGAVVDVPEDALTVLVKGSRDDDAGDVYAAAP